jgi:hypothetical protein
MNKKQELIKDIIIVSFVMFIIIFYILLFLYLI